MEDLITKMFAMFMSEICPKYDCFPGGLWATKHPKAHWGTNHKLRKACFTQPTSRPDLQAPEVPQYRLLFRMVLLLHPFDTPRIASFRLIP